MQMKETLERFTPLFSLAGFVVTSIALIVAFVSLSRTSETLNKITQRLDNLTGTVESLAVTVESLAGTVESLAETTETTRLLVQLQDDVWPSYLERIQNRTLDFKPRYLESHAGKRILTQEGRSLLDSELTNRVERISEKLGKTKPANHIIRELTVEFLLNKAKTNRVPLDILIAVVNSYIEELRKV